MVDEAKPDESSESLPPVNVWVNAGFGNGSYLCRINEDSTMLLPDELVRELGLVTGDEIEWTLDEDAFTLYPRVIRNEWQAPEWLG